MIRALENRGFTFERSADAFVNGSNPQYRSSPALAAQNSPPITPPPSTLSELQTRTFASLRKHNIHAQVDRSLRIVHCAAHYRQATKASSSSILRPSLITTLIRDKPRFLSLTIAANDPAASILLEKRLLPRFSFDPTASFSGRSTPDVLGGEENLLLGSKEDILIPIVLDLRDLPLEATGIVCGVAGRLAAVTQSRDSSDRDESGDDDDDGGGGGLALPKFPPRRKRSQQQPHYRIAADPDAAYDAVEISFLSTARAGTVIVGERELARAMASLEAESREPSMQGEDDMA